MTDPHWDWIEQWPDGCAILNPQGFCIALNSSGGALLGIRPEKLGQRSLHDCFCGGEANAQHDPSECPVEQCFQHAHWGKSLEVWWPDADGLFQPFNLRLMPSPQTAGHVIMQFATVPTGEHSIAQAMRLARYTEMAGHPMMEINREGSVMYANQSMTALMADYGFRENGTPAILPEEYPHQLARIIEDSEEIAIESEYVVPQELPEPDPFGFDEPPPAKDPEVIAYTWRYTRNDSDLEPLVNLSGFDTTAVYKTLAELRKQEETYRLTLNVTQEGVMDWFASQAFCHVSDRCFEMIGRKTPKDPQQHFDRFVSFLKPEDGKRFIEKWQNVVCGLKTRFELTVEAPGKNNQSHWLIIRGKMVEKGTYAGAARVIATVTDVSQIRQYQDVVRLQRSALDQAVNGIAILQLNGDIEYANAQWSQWFGETHTADATRIQDQVPRIKSDLKKVFQRCKSNQSWGFRYAHEATGLALWMTFSPLRSNDLSVEGIVCFARDITEDDKKAAAVSSARISAEAALRARNEAMISLEGELKDPAGNIEMALNLLEGAASDSRSREWLSIAQGALRQLKRVASRLYEAMRVESSSFVEIPVAFNLQQSLSQIVKKAETLAAAEHVPLQWTLPKSLPPESYGDAVKLEQLLSGLIQLSVNHSTHSPIQIGIDLVLQEDTHDSQLRCTVEDTKHQFSESDLNQLMQPFGMIADKSGRLSLRTNLNFGICKRIAEVMGGTLELTSNAQTGTRYKLAVPLKIYAQTDESQRQTYSTSVDTRFLRGQFDQAGTTFLAILKEVQTGLHDQGNQLRKHLESGDHVRMLDCMQQIQKTAENFALVGLAHCIEEALDLLRNPDVVLQRSPLLSVFPCLEKSLIVLGDLITSLEVAPELPPENL